MVSVYPAGAAARSRWVVALRGAKNPLDPWRPYAHLYEEETGPDGTPVPTATILLTNRECPYRCLMCDLWQNTLDETVPPGAIAAQVTHALAQLPPVRQVKLYNAGSFFDPKAIPAAEDAALARLLEPYDRVIVECHPALIGRRCAEFAGRLRGKLEVAIGLETVHPGVLERLNKRFTVEDFQRAADFLRDHDIGLRVFLLVRPPFMTEAEGVEWACRSLDMAFDSGATACCLIPTRAGNGAMEALAQSGHYTPPSLRSLEASVEYGLTLRRGRVFADLWDIERFYTCDCSPLRAARLATMNQTQRIAEPATCPLCQ
jgi:archaeosine synthase beta-subunit